MALNIWVRDTQSEETLKHAEEEEEAELELEPEEGEGLDDSPGNAEERFFEQAIKGLNLSAARALYGDSAAYLPILRSFVVHTPALLEKMPPLIEGALPDYAVMVHGLKGSCSTICAPETAEMARDLETAAKGGNVDFVRAHHGALEKAVLALVEELAGRLGAREREPAAGAGESRSAPDQALLERLAAAAGEYKTGEIEAILKELEQFRYEDGEDLVRWLREQADNFEYGEMQRRLKKYPAGEDLSGQ
jgi:HPt (histidine-containing phosphotransfer) domain-containing protein